MGWLSRLSVYQRAHLHHAAGIAIALIIGAAVTLAVFGLLILLVVVPAVDWMVEAGLFADASWGSALIIGVMVSMTLSIVTAWLTVKKIDSSLQRLQHRSIPDSDPSERNCRGT